MARLVRQNIPQPRILRRGWQASAAASPASTTSASTASQWRGSSGRIYDTRYKASRTGPFQARLFQVGPTPAAPGWDMAANRTEKATGKLLVGGGGKHRSIMSVMSVEFRVLMTAAEYASAIVASLTRQRGPEGVQRGSRGGPEGVHSSAVIAMRATQRVGKRSGMTCGRMSTRSETVESSRAASSQQRCCLSNSSYA
eukprot:1196311-Prorocentrum_minimum.AAC.6